MSSEIKVDTISENTSANGVVIDSVTLKDGAVTATAASTITVTDNSDTLSLISTDADANVGPVLRLFRNSTSPADNDVIGNLIFSGQDDAGNETDFLTFQVNAGDVGNGAEDGFMRIMMPVASTDTEFMRMQAGNIIFNEGGTDTDFRVESNGLTHALFVDAGNDIVRVGTSSGGDSANSVLQVGGGTDAVFPLHVFHTGNNSSAGPIGVQISYTASSPDSSVSPFLRCNDTTTARLLINSDGDVQNHDNSYGSTSDERIKSNIVDANSQWDDIKALKIRNYEKKDDIELYGAGKKVQIGVIAQELETAGMTGLTKDGEPDASDIKHGVPSDGKVKVVKYSVLYMKAIKALQESMSRIETLEAEVTALKGE